MYSTDAFVYKYNTFMSDERQTDHTSSRTLTEM